MPGSRIRWLATRCRRFRGSGFCCSGCGSIQLSSGVFKVRRAASGAASAQRPPRLAELGQLGLNQAENSTEMRAPSPVTSMRRPGRSSCTRTTVTPLQLRTLHHRPTLRLCRCSPTLLPQPPLVTLLATPVLCVDSPSPSVVRLRFRLFHHGLRRRPLPVRVPGNARTPFPHAVAASCYTI